jgi:two-component system cell cycle sensor histidine kinase/response regulator CckA
MISECNQALIRASDESELLNTVCEIVVQVGAYRMAWVGYAENDAARSVRPVAHAGHASGYLEQLNCSWADSERGRCASGIAIRSGHPCVLANIANEPGFATLARWRHRAGLCRPVRLAAAHGERILGALSIYSAVLDAFDAEEVALLSELADDLSFGISVCVRGSSANSPSRRCARARRATGCSSTAIRIRCGSTTGTDARLPDRQ